MLNFKTASLCFIIECIAIILLHHFLGISLWWLLLLIIIYKALIIYGSAYIQSNFYIKTLCSSSSDEKQIAISFDDGPNAEHTPKILSTLAEYNVNATFFVIGKNIPGNESVIKKTDALGHTIGNHTFSHSFFIDFKSKAGFMYELDTTSYMIFKIIGKRVKFFRPPYGVTTPNLAKASKALNYQIIGWNIRSLDTTKDTEAKIVERVISQIKPGAIILFHDTSEKTLQVLKQTLNFAKENGFKIVGIEELLKIKAYA
jgi:peptidoglycan/xylan/chitin deacetylase (PgdA/CDA1 family)